VEGGPSLRAADFAFKEARESLLAEAHLLTLELENQAQGIRLDVVYNLGDPSPFIRRRLELSVTKPLAIRQVDVWLVGLKGKASHQGLGEPVFLDDTFWGLEYPGGHDHYANGTVRLTHYPHQTATRFVSKTAVLGVAEPERVAEQFRRYVRFEVIAFEKAPLFVNYNTWWTLMPPTEKNCLELIDLFQRKLFAPHGESFDTFTIDDGWDDKNSLWAIRKDRFPRGFAPLVAPLKTMKANLGLWLSPSSGYHHAPWLTTKGGYLKGNNAWYCVQSDPKYRRDIAEVVTHLAKQYDLAFYKFDGFSASNVAQAEGMPKGEYAREANIDAYIELMTAVKRAKPGIFLDPTCGMWLSPWWLRYCDSIWGSVSGDYPSIVVPAPIIRDSATTTRDAIFRQRCREHPGYPPAAIEHLGIIVITPEKWEDNAMAVVGRGCHLLTLYINPKHFDDDRDWAFLASLLKWTRHNAATLGHTKLIGGDPLKRKWYGYAHFAGTRGIIALRNPFIEPQTVKLKLDETCGWTAKLGDGTHLVARIIYPREEVLGSLLPHSDTLELRLQAYETMTIHIEPVGTGQHQHLNGVRARETERAGHRARYAVYGRPGQKLTASAGAPLRRATLDGRELPVVGAGGVGLPIAFAGGEQPCRVEGARLTARVAEAAWQLEGTCVANIPPGTKATMHLLCDPRGAQGTLDCTAQVNGKPVTVRAVRRPTRGSQTHGAHAWGWFEFPLPEGRSEVTISVAPTEANAFFRGEVGWWLWAEHPLKEHTLTLTFPKPLPPATKEPLPLPLGMDTEREIITIQAAKVMRAGTRWPTLDQSAVDLANVAPDEAKQEWGSLQQNQSVWEKPMVVAGRKFTRGLGTHANSRIVYDLTGGKFRRFRCLVGRDEHAMEGKVVFQVWLDGKKAFDSGPMGKTTPAKPVDIDVRGADILELRTLDGGDGIGGDHGNWADAELVR